MLVDGRPIITLCGSTRFKEFFINANEELTLAGAVVFSVGLFGHADAKYDSVITPEIKEQLDKIHRAKISISDAIFVLNANNYIGESTRSEIEYAQALGKMVFYAISEPDQPDIKQWIRGYISRSEH